jgi:carboxyl-terminal processing protease
MIGKKLVSKAFLYLLLPLILATLACQAAIPGSRLAPTPTVQPSPTQQPTQILPTLRPTITPTPPLPTPSPTFTSTATPTITPTARPTASSRQMRVFEQLWGLVNENYLYPDFNGLDWKAVREEFRQRIEAGLSIEEFYQAMSEMIERLGDDHSRYLSPDDVVRAESELSGQNDFVGIGAMVMPVPERQRATLVFVFPGSPAEQAGLKAHDSILEVDGQPILENGVYQREKVLGPAGTQVELLIQSPGEEPRPVTITRGRITGETPVPYQVLTTPDGKRIGYIFLLSFGDMTFPGKVKEAIRAMNAEGRLDGLIIDNRMNPGGLLSIMGEVLSYFVNGRLGTFVDRESEEPFEVTAENIAGSQKVPLVVLVGDRSASAGEIFSGIIKDFHRGYIIGERTDGNVELLYVYNLLDGSRAWIAHSVFRPQNNPESNWELNGILPDLTVKSNWDEVTEQTDPVIKAALEYFDK